MRNSHKLQAVWLTAALAALIGGCGHNSGGGGGTTGGATGSGGGGGKTLQIAVIPKGTSHEYWKSIHAGANKAKEDLAKQGTNIDVIWKGTESEGDRNGQVSVVDTFVTQHVDGIVLAPLDNHALVRPVHDAADRKIPVVIIDSSLEGNDYVSFAATDNEKGGELAGEQLAKLLNGKGRVILLPYMVGSASTLDREKGFMTAVKKYPGITVLSNNQFGGPTTDTAYTASQNLLTRFRGQVDGVFASNESNTRGMHRALQQANLLHKIKFVGFDASPDLLKALQADELQGLVAQNPFHMGDVGVTTVVQAIQGKTVPKTIDTGVALITKENMNDPSKQEFLHPPLDQYLK